MEAIIAAMTELLDAVEAFKEDQREKKALQEKLWERLEKAEQEAEEANRQLDRNAVDAKRIKEAQGFLLEYEFLVGEMRLVGSAQLDAERLRRRVTHWLQRDGV